MKGTIVVIGCGPSRPELCGADIDRHPVVRMWNHEWQTVERFGSRYDYGMITNTKDAISASRRPGKCWLFYNVPHDPPASHIDAVPVVELDQRKWRVKAAAHGATPGDPQRKPLKFSRGFAAVAGVIEHLRPRRVIVVGMGVLCNGETGTRYYDPDALPFYVKSYPRLAHAIPKWAADEMPAGVRRDGPHDFFAESKIIREIAQEAGTELVWECAA